MSIAMVEDRVYRIYVAVIKADGGLLGDSKKLNDSGSPLAGQYMLKVRWSVNATLFTVGLQLDCLHWHGMPFVVRPAAA